MVIIKFMKNLFDVVMFIVNKQNVQHVYHLKLNNNYYLMKMIKKINTLHLRQLHHNHNNRIHMVLFKDILNNHHLHHNKYNPMVVFIHHTIPINLMVLHQLNQTIMVLVLHLLMLYSHGQMLVLLVDQLIKKFNVYVVIFIH